LTSKTEKATHRPGPTTSTDLVWASYLRARRAGYSGWLSFRINATTATSAVAAAMAGKAVVNPMTVMVKRPAFVNPKMVNTTPAVRGRPDRLVVVGQGFTPAPVPAPL